MLFVWRQYPANGPSPLIPQSTSPPTTSMIAFIGSIAICTIEGLLGMSLNVTSIVLLLRGRKNLMDRVYRVTMYVCALHGALLCFLITVLNFVHIFRDGTFAAPTIGPLSWILPDLVCDMLFEIALVFTPMMWILIPAHSTLQFITLNRYVFSFEKRVILAFTVPVACTICVVYFAPGFLPSPAFKVILENITRDVFKFDPQQQFHVYGSTVKYVSINSGRSMVEIMIGLAIVPYFVSYGMFATFAVLIRRRLRAFGVSLSARTLRIQRAFHVMQLLQGLLPLAIISVPLIFFNIGTVLRLNLNLATLVFTAFLWACPWVQAAVQLRFIRQSTSYTPETTRTVSTSQRTTRDSAR